MKPLMFDTTAQRDEWSRRFAERSAHLGLTDPEHPALAQLGEDLHAEIMGAKTASACTCDASACACNARAAAAAPPMPEPAPTSDAHAVEMAAMSARLDDIEAQVAELAAAVSELMVAGLDVNQLTQPAQPAAVGGKSGLTLADRSYGWDATAAEGRVREWATSGGTVDWAKYGQAFFWHADNPSKLGDFKLGFADIVNGKLTAVPRGIFAVAGALAGARGGVDIPASDRDAVKSKVAGYYDKLGAKPPF